MDSSTPTPRRNGAPVGVGLKPNLSQARVAYKFWFASRQQLRISRYQPRCIVQEAESESQRKTSPACGLSVKVRLAIRGWNTAKARRSATAHRPVQRPRSCRGSQTASQRLLDGQFPLQAEPRQRRVARLRVKVEPTHVGGQLVSVADNEPASAHSPLAECVPLHGPAGVDQRHPGDEFKRSRDGGAPLAEKCAQLGVTADKPRGLARHAVFEVVPLELLLPGDSAVVPRRLDPELPEVVVALAEAGQFAPFVSL